MADSAERVFVGGLPYYLTDEQCNDLVKDRDTGTSKGCARPARRAPRGRSLHCDCACRAVRLLAVY